MDVEPRLRELGVPSLAYCIGGAENEAYCLLREADGWHVFYSERGNRNNERVFDSESAAGDELVRVVSKDRIVGSGLE